MSRWVGYWLSVDWLFLSHWREDSIVSVLGLWSVLVELDLGMSHLVLILVHRPSKSLVTTDPLDSGTIWVEMLLQIQGDKEKRML